MTSQDKKRLAMAQALRSAFREQILEESPTSEEISQMLVDNGEDPDTIALQYKNIVADRIRAIKKERMLGFRRQNTAASSAFGLRGVPSARSAPLPSIEVMRSQVQALSTTAEFDKSSLAIAYRNGTRQSDSDISSLYQDLLDLGVIKDGAES